MDDSATLVLNEATKSQQPSRPPTLNNLPVYSTPQQNGNLNANNTQTVVKKRIRQATVTVDSNQTTKEIEAIFAHVQNTQGVDNPMQEIQRHVQKLFIQKEREWEYKLNVQSEKQIEAGNEELALTKIKFKMAQSLLSRMDEFTKKLNVKANCLSRLSDQNGQHQQNDGLNGFTSPQTARTFSLDLAEITKERDSLREELGQLENSYSDLFKRYEKMRENCVLLKNSEEELKNMVEEEQTKYERLLASYQELRESAAIQLNQANMEIQRIIKQHEENTLGLRCRLKMNETQIQTLNLTIQGKDSQIEELNKMVEELMKKNGIMDDADEDLEGDYE